jgi:tetratricopeptide (TPR) repeat protein
MFETFQMTKKITSFFRRSPSQKNHTHLRFLYGSLFLVALISTVWIYWGGLNSIYLFDDSPNLEDLADIDNINDMAKFVTEGISSQMGRPVSLLTFALQAHNWPSNPWAFKYVNLMIHLLNGCLIFWLILSLTRLMKLPEKQCLLLSVLTASLWLLHPLQVSTVLYVIQRMTQLTVFFTLAGLLVYLKGRQQLGRGELKSGFFWVSLGVGLGGILATLSKENGILLVLYILVLEFTVLHTLQKPRYWRLWSWIFLYFPLILLAFYFATHLSNLLQSYQIRDFTMGERLLTEARVLTDYLTKILFPRPQAFGLFQDDYRISRHLLNPPSTLIAVIFITTMFGAAIHLRRRYPVFSMGVLWFLAGHLLESSFIGLVIAFEHRNYLPSLGVLFASIYGILWVFDHLLTAYLRKIAMLFSALWLAFFLFVSWSQTDLWGKPPLQAALWADEKPLSRYAQLHAAALFASRGDYQRVQGYYQKMTKTFPQDTSPYLLWLLTACLSDQVEPPKLEQVLHYSQSGQMDNLTGSALNTMIGRAGQCQHLLPSDIIHQLFKAVLNNPNGQPYRSNLYVIYAKYYANQKDYDMAVFMADKASANTPQLKMQRLLWLIKGNRFDEALSYIKQIREQSNSILTRLYADDLNYFEGLAFQLRDMFKEIEQHNISKQPT